MNDCLVTRLKASVDNENLVKPGELKLIVNGGYLDLRHGSSVTVTFKYPVDVLNNVGAVIAQGQTSWITTPNSLNTFISPSGYDNIVSIPDKYNVYQLVVGGSAQTNPDSVDFKGLSSLSAIYRLVVNANDSIKGINLDYLGEFAINDNFILTAPDITDISGDISCLANSTNVLRVYISSADSHTISNVTGDITSLSTLTNLNELVLRDTRVAGNADTFLTTLAASGRTTDLTFIPATNMVFLGTTGNRTMKVIKFNSGMVNPTEEDTERGWQVAS